MSVIFVGLLHTGKPDYATDQDWYVFNLHFFSPRLEVSPQGSGSLYKVWQSHGWLTVKCKWPGYSYSYCDKSCYLRGSRIILIYVLWSLHFEASQRSVNDLISLGLSTRLFFSFLFLLCKWTDLSSHLWLVHTARKRERELTNLFGTQWCPVPFPVPEQCEQFCKKI